PGLMRVSGREASARRIIRETYRDLAGLADGAAVTRNQWASRMLDRVALLLYRQPRFEPRPQHEFADALRDLRLGANIIETRSIGSGKFGSNPKKPPAKVSRPPRYFPALPRGPGAPP